jgi:CBS domain-containing protein
MLVRQAMLPDPLVVKPDTSVYDFCKTVLNSNQTTATVIDDADHICGIVSLHDVFDKIVPPYIDIDSKLARVIHEEYFEEKFAEFERMTVGDIMVKEVEVLRPNDSVITAVAMLFHRRHKSIPVIENGKFVGTVTRRSVLRHVTNAVRP